MIFVNRKGETVRVCISGSRQPNDMKIIGDSIDSSIKLLTKLEGGGNLFKGSKMGVYAEAGAVKIAWL